MSEAQSAMTTWIGTLAHGGLLRTPLEEAGVTVAAYVVGEERLAELREWMLGQSKETLREHQIAAIRICIWMANADRELDPEESHLLREIITNSDLDEDTQDALVAEVHDPPSMVGIEDQLVHPVLRELMVALAWELACSDGSVAPSEEAFAAGIGKRLGVDAWRVDELRHAVTDRVSQPPSA
ncbi:MAG: TerB family tellurite resistance protein [Myxococcales bacterium]|nr:TerB family tellurite resistance protein [Myxococcales bacterium]